MSQHRPVYVWFVEPTAIVGDEVERRAFQILSPDEQVRQRRFKFPQHRHQFLVSHALVRTVLSHYAAVRPEQWQFRVGPWGRPEIDTPDRDAASLRFNLSHTDGMAVCAVSWESDLGVDVECLTRNAPGIELARRYFSPTEVEWLSKVAPEHQQRTFFDFWTLKEAYIKARGMGLAIPLDHFSFDLSDRFPIRIGFAPELVDDPQSWQFAQHQPTEQHLISLALRRGHQHDAPIHWQCGDDLLRRLLS